MDQVRGGAPAWVHLRLVPEGRDNGAQRELLDHRAAQRCPRMPQCWARAHELHLRHGHKFSAREDGRSVKTQRAFDAYAPTFCQPSAVWSAEVMHEATHRRQGSCAAHTPEPSKWPVESRHEHPI